MSTQHRPAAAADRYPDPSRKHQYRYWDGTAWTEHVTTHDVQSVAPLDAAPTALLSPWARAYTRRRVRTLRPL
ncbi:MAG: DUF2510 domain-containing protein [Microbacterium sp.]